MRPSDQIALVVGIGAALLAGVLARWMGGAWAVALLCTLLGGIAGWALVDREPEPAPVEPNNEPVEAPDIDAFVAAFDEPLLLVEEGRVTRANAAAERVLGGH